MKEKAYIYYIKNKREVMKNVHLLNKYHIMKDIFVNPFAGTERMDYYQVQEEVSLLYLKNVTFYQEVKFFCSNNTILILDHCIFKGNVIHMNGGSVQLIAPILPQAYYTNCIFGRNLLDCDIKIQDSNSNYLSISVDALKIQVDGEQRVNNLYLDGNDVTIKNINAVKNFIVKAQHMKMIETDLNIMDNCKDNYGKFVMEISKDLTLVESCIGSYHSLNISTPKIIMDESSYFYSYDDIRLNGNIYLNLKKKEMPLVLERERLHLEEEKSLDRKMISVLKGITQKCEEELQTLEEKNETSLHYQRNCPEETKTLAQKKTLGIYKNRPIGSYNSLNK